jgi:heme oxygenase (biliverdin-IX-beta and delta-forming)
VPVLLEAELQSPLPALRAATRGPHDRIDRLMDLRRLCEPSRYARVLQVFDAFLPAWETAVLDALPRQWHGWLRARSRRPFLARDLQALGIATHARRLELAPLRSEAAAWGSLYVIEGSALGGQVITRALAAEGLRPEAGAAYFHGWGDSTGGMWRDFRQLLDRELQEPAALSQACESACQTFETLSGLLEQALHERAPAA